MCCFQPALDEIVDETMYEEEDDDDDDEERSKKRWEHQFLVDVLAVSDVFPPWLADPPA